MNPELFTYHGPFWTFLPIDYILPCVFALAMTVLVIFLSRKFSTFRENRAFFREYSDRIQRLDLSDPSFMTDISLLFRAFLDTIHYERFYTLTTSATKIPDRKEREYITHTLSTLETLNYSDSHLSDVEKEKARAQILTCMKILFSHFR